MRKSFTLLEMLVVIGIIAILVSMGFASYSTVQKKARDSKRQGDLKAFQNAMEQCYSINDFAYPIISGGATTSISEDCPIASGQDLTIIDPSTKTYTVNPTTTATYTVQITLESGAIFRIDQQQ